MLLAEPDVEREGLVKERLSGRRLHAEPDDAVEERTVERWQRCDRHETPPTMAAVGPVGSARPRRRGAHESQPARCSASSHQRAILSSGGVSEVVERWGIVPPFGGPGSRDILAGRACRVQLVAATVRR